MKFKHYVFIVPLLIPTLALALNSNQIKPCFARYNGHKLFDATPFHSEYRMKDEEDCLPFCVKASSRCASIVYDKFAHICYYFSVNGIDSESIERNPHMVYLQVAERRCVDNLLILMEQDESQASGFSSQGQTQYSFGEPIKFPADYGKIQYGIVETKIEVPHDAQTNQSEGFYDYTTTLPIDTSADEEYSTTKESFSEDLNSEQRTQLEESSPSGVEPIGQAQSDASPPIDSTENATTVKQTAPFPPINIIDPIPSFLPVMSVFKATKRQPIEAIESENSTDSQFIFEAQMKLQNDTKVEPTNFHISNEIKRHPQSNKRYSEEHMDLDSSDNQQKMSHEQSPVNSFSVDDDQSSFSISEQSATIQKSIPQVENLPLFTSEDTGEDIDSLSCNEQDGNEIWLAVEGAKFSKSNQNEANLNMVHLPVKDCMQACKLQKTCDAFTYHETTSQCQFHSVGKIFSKTLVTERRGDFTMRAFYRLCYPNNFLPFKNCAEFLAFQYYSLEIPPREFFNGLPSGAEGISACIELCVLSSDFQCRSALFDLSGGMCQLFDEHSLSKPLAFKEHSKRNHIYFENGCTDGGDVPQEPSSSKFASSTMAKQMEIQPVPPKRFNYKNLFH